VRGIPRGEAHIWLVRPESAGDPGLLREYERLLDDGEKRQRDRLIPDEARHHQVVTRALVRTMLSTYTGIDPKRWLLATNAHGRPEILEPVECAHIRFNVSHTHGLIACIAADAREVGIDVEWADRAGRLVELAERFFSKKEADAIRALDGDAQRDRFFETWTLKESFIKAIGLGVSFGLSRFAFAIDGDNTTIGFDAGVQDVPTRWQFLLRWPDKTHALAAAARREASERITFKIREMIPLRD